MTVSILGCGWVGSALKEHLQSKQIRVNCLSKNIEQNRANGYYNCNILVIALPPSTENYLNILKQTQQKLNPNRAPQIIFLSSTSFYSNKKIVAKAEELIKKLYKNVVILRLAGLMGYDRVAGKYSQGKTIPNSPTNYVHRDDVVSIIAKTVELKIEGKIYDIVAPIQSTKEIIFKKNAKKFGFKEPKIIDNKPQTIKKITPNKIIQDLKYTFKKPNVLEFWDEE